MNLSAFSLNSTVRGIQPKPPVGSPGGSCAGRPLWTGYFCRTCTLANVAPRPLLVSKTMMKPLRGNGTCGSCAPHFTENLLVPVPLTEPPGIVTQSSAVAPGSAAHCDPGAVVT